MYDTFMILALLMFINCAGGFYIYLRFGPRKLVMIAMPKEKYDEYFESLPPIALLNKFGKRLLSLACASIAIALFLLSKLFISI